ncbi:KN motif and ankyrin repeat domain-containing protein 2 [Rhinatrema bivittatum]|uniref:KN motif and ankyrin repeat domain-containing protein 2 n=1 Tax=Rhinatrema bivittatum TaxID=194408 RepID=UPI00112698E7|nr:KN motif and ankyrin repeat domain-containing protein 2 [Rhinatrema bivittatum]XP_029441056.1 KN motif and ankyrin repeat domain-containing protein 2 [Rhinatrema bivittatum]XP_029441057.1 KN motif and ankyrin repeat domain-containing protein 2 [Rhinatrema bivittatum]
MAQVLHMESAFPGKSNPTSPSAFRGKEQDLPYSVETPYGYRLDLDFLKYVDDIEKGHTIKRIPVHRRPRYSSLPRGYGYTGSWWTSTESLCSNASVDSRQSSFSYCGKGFYPAYGLENRAPLMGGFNARVEKTLLDAKKKLEEDHVDSGDSSKSKITNLGSLQGSRSGSTSSLVGAGLNQSFSKLSSHNGSQPGAPGQFTPLSSGLSTPVSPTPVHLQHVREQMAVALKKLRQLEEQVKMIPVLQVKISVLQEEKRQLGVQLKSQKFLGHLGKSRSRGELYIDIPEEDNDRGGNEVLSPTTSGPGSDQERSRVQVTQQVQKKEAKSAGIGTEESPTTGKSETEKVDVASGSPPEMSSRGVLVKEQDLGISSLGTQVEVDKQRQVIHALSAKIAVLEKQLRKALSELQAAQQRLEQQVMETKDSEKVSKPPVADASSMTDAEGQEKRQSREVVDIGLQMSSWQHPSVDRTIGVPVCTTEHSMGDLWKHQEVPIKVDTVRVVQIRKEPEIAASTATGVDHKPQRAQSLENKESYASLKALTARDPSEAEVATHHLTETPYTVYRTDEVIQTSFPLHASPTTSLFHHVVKKISITSHGEESAGSSKGDMALCQAPPEALPEWEMTRAVVESAASQTAKAALQEAATADATREAATPQDELASSQAAIKSIMKKMEDSGDSPATRKSLQFVGVNGGYESNSSEDSGTAENVSDNESTESEYHEACEGLLLVPVETGENQSQILRTDAPGLGKEEARMAGTPSSLSATPSVSSSSPASLSPVAAAATPSVSCASPAAESPRGKECEEGPKRVEVGKDLLSACVSLQKYLENPDTLTDAEMRSAYASVLQGWLQVLRHKDADPEVVCHHMAIFRAMSPQLLKFIINMADGNGNTALHYAVSQSSFPIVRLLLETGFCDVDRQNKAGYTPIMLTALAALHSEGDMESVLQLLKLGNVNAKASQAGQTTLMLAVSHGRSDVVKALLTCAADVNLQDDDGSTALMCACEHGHVGIVNLLLAMPDCDITLTDNDGSTALSIALEAGNNDIAVLLYAHMNFTKSPSLGAATQLKEECTLLPTDGE